MEAFGVEEEIKSTIGRRVDLPSGGYLIFDYAEAFTVIDVNTGRFVGGRGKNAGGRLEDTITKNNLEAVKEVVRQLRLRDIGGIIVIDFIDMANPKNRSDRRGSAAHGARARPDEDLRRRDLAARARGDDAPERDRRAARGDDAQVPDVRRRRHRLLRGLGGDRRRAAAARARGGLAGASVPGRARRCDRERARRPRRAAAGRARGDDEEALLPRGQARDRTSTTSSSSARASSSTWRHPRRSAEDAEVMLQLVEIDRYDGAAAVGKLDGLDVVVADAASLVGKRVKVRVERVLDGRAYARRDPEDEGGARAADGGGRGREADAQAAGAEGRGGREGRAEPRGGGAEEPETAEDAETEPEAGAEEPTGPRRRWKPRRRRSRRRGRGAAPAAAATARRSRQPSRRREPSRRRKATVPEQSPRRRAVTIHVPGDDLGREGAVEPVETPAAEPERPRRPRGRRRPKGEAADSKAQEEDEARLPRRQATGRRSRRLRPRTAAEAAAGAEEPVRPKSPRRTASSTTSRCPSGPTSSSPRVSYTADSRAPGPRFHAMSPYAIISLGGKQYRVHGRGAAARRPPACGRGRDPRAARPARRRQRRAGSRSVRDRHRARRRSRARREDPHRQVPPPHGLQEAHRPSEPAHADRDRVDRRSQACGEAREVEGGSEGDGAAEAGGRRPRRRSRTATRR